MTTSDATHPAAAQPRPPGADGGRESVAAPDPRFQSFFNDPRWALAMVRATVLEAAHPKIGAALIDNSTFVAHPWRRLRNTFLSMQRMIGADEQVRDREAARLNRMHERLRGTDSQNRPYDAMDPGARAWVLATLYESSVTMCRLSGQPLEQTFLEDLYAEFRAVLAIMGDEPGHLPDSLPEFWRYYDRMVEEELENTEAMRVILYKLFDHLPAPPLLSGFPTLWATGRTVAGPVVGAIAVASLPEPFRRRAGLPEMPGAQTLMQGAYLAVGLTRFLPAGWIRPEAVIDLLSLSPDSDDPRARTVAALHSRMKRAGALLRLITPLPAQSEPATRTTSATASAHQQDAEGFFRHVLDQTGNGSLDWPDLAAMARELSSRLDLDEPEETRLYQAFADWWRELQSALDSDGDGSISAQEYASAAPRLAGPALIRVAETLFDVTDKNGNQQIDADEYRTLFRTAFHRDISGAEGATYSRSDFVREFLTFMSGRQRTTRFDPLLAGA